MQQQAIRSPTNAALFHRDRLVSKLRPLIDEAQLPPRQTSLSVKPSVLYFSIRTRNQSLFDTH